MSELVFPSLSEVVARHCGELRAYARRKVGNAATAEDLVQEACLRLASTDGRQVGNPRAFLYRIVGRLVIDHWRREQVRSKAMVPADAVADRADDAPDAERQLAAKQELAVLASAIAELPPRCRECFELRRFEDLDHAAIAARMGISRNMVEKHLRYATLHCMKRLDAAR
ncbi:putative RNA polymerase sigma factor FecI [bacterium YEK0313]|nr:putative RNA polymerase sigma factor FecI [bacterium YEK0313]